MHELITLIRIFILQTRILTIAPNATATLSIMPIQKRKIITFAEIFPSSFLVLGIEYTGTVCSEPF